MMLQTMVVRVNRRRDCVALEKVNKPPLRGMIGRECA